ncbi:hypothetical protein F2P81_011993 [Scophthalmus maximus]|uniref:Uncharacterized protein n=1 Tax=Scophthalmus maximus TaxID=52904 RepID=A0A6A4T090_SCOMX|nr:hypothetical protein F2P81_011993 [Scophthalmus maximus]
MIRTIGIVHLRAYHFLSMMLECLLFFFSSDALRIANVRRRGVVAGGGKKQFKRRANDVSDDPTADRPGTFLPYILAVGQTNVHDCTVKSFAVLFFPDFLTAALCNMMFGKSEPLSQKPIYFFTSDSIMFSRRKLHSSNLC